MVTVSLKCETTDCHLAGVVFPDPSFQLAEDERVICGACNEPTTETTATPWTEEQIRAHLEGLNHADPAN